jgi:hypothetical protein
MGMWGEEATDKRMCEECVVGIVVLLQGGRIDKNQVALKRDRLRQFF